VHDTHSTVKVGFDRELSATEFILMAYGSKMSEVLWNDFPQKSEVRKGLKSRVEFKMAAVPERISG